MSQQIAEVRHNLYAMKQEFAKVLPAHIKPEKIVRSVCNALQGNKALLRCNRQSIYTAAMTAAVLGLEVDSAIGQGYIVPFRGDAQFIPGYKGYITLAFNSGFIVSCEVVRKRDQFEYSMGMNPTLTHVPAQGDIDERGEITFSYAVARHSNMPSVFKVIDLKQIHASRDHSSGYNAFKKGTATSSVWEEHFPAMCAKTAVRALAPLLPLNVQRAAALEGAYDRGTYSYIDSHGSVISTQQEQSKISSEQPKLITEESEDSNHDT